MSFRPIHTLLALTAAATTLLAQPAAAQDFPRKPITLTTHPRPLIPFPISASCPFKGRS